MICQVCEKTTKSSTVKICSTCNSNLRRYAIKEELVHYKGGKCKNCGYNKSIRSLTFHHRNPNEKDFNISSSHGRALTKLKQEVDKCDLLCHNCHHELHEQIELNKNSGLRLRWKHYKENRDIYKKEIQSNREKTCPTCKKEFLAKKSAQIYCCKLCVPKYNKPKLSIDMVSTIQTLVLQQSIKDISIQLNMSPSYISNFCKKHDIETPSRQYWNKIKTKFCVCKNCKKLFKPSSKGGRQKYCSNQCRITLQELGKPSKEELKQLIWEKPTTHIAKQFGVSDKAVEKWCKKYGIEKPPRGYWMKQSKAV